MRPTTRSRTVSARSSASSRWEPVSDLFHAASIEVAVPAEAAFAYLSDGLKQGDWTLGSWNREQIGERLFKGTSLFTGAETFVRITAHPEHCSSTTTSARRSTRCSASTPRAQSRGRSSADPRERASIALTKWRQPDEDDAQWRRGCVTFDTEIHMIKGRLELGF